MIYIEEYNYSSDELDMQQLIRGLYNGTDVDWPDEFWISFLTFFWKIVTPILFAVILLIGTIGNCLVLYVIASRREVRSITNLMLVNLAVADLAFLFTCVPYNAFKYAQDAWLFGDIS